MRNGKRIGVVIPALDEEAGIARVLRDIPAWADQVVVADNGSSDRTAEVAASLGATVVFEAARGYGAACHAGWMALAPCDVVVFLDADYSDSPAEMALLVDPVVQQQADLVVGSRVLGRAERGALTPQQRFGNWFACLLMRRLFGARYTDLGPFRAVSARALRAIAMEDRGYGWTVEMQIKAARMKFAACEVPVSYRPRIGVSKISGTLRGSVLAGAKILQVIARSARQGAPASVAPSP